MAWSQIEREAQRLTLPRGPFAVLNFLAHYAHPDGTGMYPGVKLISAHTHYCERSVQSFLRYLEREGWIIPVDRKGGRNRTTLYHFALGQFEQIIAQPPPPEEPPPPEQRERFIQGILKKKRLSDERRAHWQAELAKVQQQLAPDDFLDDEEPAEQTRHLPAIVNQARHVPALATAQDEEFRQLEATYIGTIALQARCARDSREWHRFDDYLDWLREEYDKACAARGIVASDGQTPIVDQELQEQIGESMRSTWETETWETETMRLSNLVQIRTQKRESFEPGSRKWNMYTNLINQAQNTLNSMQEQKNINDHDRFLRRNYL